MKTRHNKSVERNNKSCESGAQNGRRRGSLKGKRQMLKGTQTTSCARKLTALGTNRQLCREANQNILFPRVGVRGLPAVQPTRPTLRENSQLTLPTMRLTFTSPSHSSSSSSSRQWSDTQFWISSTVPQRSADLFSKPKKSEMKNRQP
jgi:hypothetical protein